MGRARVTRALQGAWAPLALLALLGSVACQRPGQAEATSSVDMTSPGSRGWPVIEPEPEGPQPTDADVEQIAVKVPRSRVPAVTAKNPTQGPASAKVTLQVFSDFQCPFCVQVAPTLADLEARYRGKVRLVWRNYPLPSHARALPAARAAQAVFTLGGSERFWQLHDIFYSAQADLTDAGLARAATKLSLDPSVIQQAAASKQYDADIAADVAAGNAAGIEGTPAVFVNDYYLMGARSEAEYAVVVERALREAG
jgi:protein-disulfide isomerase